MKKLFVLFALFAFSALTALHAATLPNDIRFQQFDGLQWNWIEVRPINAGALTFDGSLQFAVESAKQPLLSETSNITASNATLNGWIKLSSQTNQIGDNGSALTFNGSAIGAGWTNYTAPDSEGGTIQITASTLTQTPAAFAINYLTNFLGNYSSVVSIGYEAMDVADVAAANTGILSLGDYALYNAQLTNSYNVFAYGPSALQNSELANSYNVFAYGNSALDGASLTNSQNVFAYGPGALQNSELTNSYNVFAYGQGAGGGAALTNSSDIYAFGSSAGLSLSGEFTHVFLIGSGAQATDSNDWVAGDALYRYKFPGTNGAAFASVVTATNGLSSLATTAAVNIAETGWTNTFGKLANVDFDGTAMTFTVYDNAGTALYTNAVAHTGAFNRVLQTSGKIIISGTGVAGSASPL